MLFILLFIFLFNLYVYKTFLNPVLLQSLIWLVYYIILAQNINFFSVSGIDKLNYYIIFQSIGFSLGGYICHLFTKKKTTETQIATNNKKLIIPQQNTELFYPYILIVLCISLVGIIMQSGSMSISKIADLRTTLTEDDGKKYGLFGLIQSIVSVYLILVFAVLKKPSIKYKILLGLFLYYSLLLGGKGPFLFFFGGLFYMVLWQNKIKKIIVVYATVALIVLMGLVTNLRFGDSEATVTNGDVLKDLILTYTVASIPALEIAQADAPKIFGYHTFRIAYIWINKLGFDIPIDPVLSKYTTTPLPTNTYSYIKPYYYDFGYTGVFVLPLILGIVHNFFYYRASKGKLGSIVITALLMFPLITQILEEQYFRWITNWLYFSIFIFIITKVKIYDHRSSNCNVQPTIG